MTDKRPLPESDISRAEFVYRQLREGIRSGLYRPGQRIREAQLAEALNTSRTPVREAIRRLETDRLIEDVPGRGLAIAALNEAQVRELYLFRAALEGNAAEMAALQASAFDIAALREILEQMRDAAAEAPRAATLNRQLHQGICQAARNTFLTHAMAPLNDFMALLPGTTYQTPGRMADVLAEHEAIVQAIAERTPIAAAAAMRAHIEAAGRFRLQMMFSLT